MHLAPRNTYSKHFTCMWWIYLVNFCHYRHNDTSVQRNAPLSAWFVACARIVSVQQTKASSGWNYLSIHKLQILGMDMQFNPTFYWACDYLSTLGLKCCWTQTWSSLCLWMSQRRRNACSVCIWSGPSLLGLIRRRRRSIHIEFPTITSFGIECEI